MRRNVSGNTPQAFQIACIYAKAIQKLGFELPIFERIKNEISLVSSHDIEKLELPDIQKLPLSKESLQILSLLFKQKKLFILKALSEQLTKEFLRISNAISFKITSVSKISEQEITELKQNLKTFFKKEIFLEEALEPDLIGGFTLSFDSFLFDFSKKSKISKIKACILKS
jgi:F-type H+-transporting ATPase subunit delta